jgi:hypothetical protein
MTKASVFALAIGTVLAGSVVASAGTKPKGPGNPGSEGGSWSWSASCYFTESVTNNELKIKNLSSHGLAHGSVVQVAYKYKGANQTHDVHIPSDLKGGSEVTVHVPQVGDPHTSCSAKVTGGTPLEH